MIIYVYMIYLYSYVCIHGFWIRCSSRVTVNVTHSMFATWAGARASQQLGASFPAGALDGRPALDASCTSSVRTGGHSEWSFGVAIPGPEISMATP